MTCEALINQFLLDYVEGRLRFARKAEFEFHLAMCSACRKYLSSYRKTVALAHGSREPESAPPPELIDAILKTVQAT